MMKVERFIDHIPSTVLIDSNSTSSFLDEDLAKSCISLLFIKMSLELWLLTVRNP